MKAFLLTAGLGTRLRPLTDTKPKCLLPICGKPLLQIWLEQLQKYGVSDVLINTHHFAELIQEYASNYKRPPYVTLTYEQILLGSGGTVWENKDFVDGEDSFWVLYGDNLSSANLARVVQFHEKHDGILTVGLFQPDRPKECGIAVLDQKGKILEFEEKPDHPKTNLANAGVYLIRNSIFRDVSWDFEKPVDFGYHILTQLNGKMYGIELDGFHLDIGTLTNYERAQKECPTDLLKKTKI